MLVVNLFCTGLLTWTTDDKDEERQEPRSHRHFIITDVSLREFTFRSVAFYLLFTCAVQWDLVTKVYSIKNHLLIPYINSLIKRRTLKSVKLILYMKLISLLLLHNWTSWRVSPMMIWRCLSGWCFCCVSRWPYESSVWRPSLQMLLGVKVSWRVTNMTNTN